MGQMMKQVLSVFILCSTLAFSTYAQTAKPLSDDVIAANKELDRQLLEAHRLLDTEKVMALFTSSPDIFFISPGRGELFTGHERFRRSWAQFFDSLQWIHGEIDHITYLREGEGVIGNGQVTYSRQLKGGKPDQRIVVWTDFRHKENGKWVYVFRHAHLTGGALPDAKPSAAAPSP